MQDILKFQIYLTRRLSKNKMQWRREEEKTGGWYFWKWEKVWKNVKFSPKSERIWKIFSLKIRENLKDIFYQNWRKLERYFIPKSEKAVSKFSKAGGRYPSPTSPTNRAALDEMIVVSSLELFHVNSPSLSSSHFHTLKYYL